MSQTLIIAQGRGHSVRVSAEIAQFEAPKPARHPIRALSGALVSGYRPWDHGDVTLAVVAGESRHTSVTWFVRYDALPGVNPSPASYQEMVLTLEETLAHRFMAADGAGSRDPLESYLAGADR